MTIQTGLPGVVLRDAEPKDTALVLGFIRALAEYEKLAHEVVATEDSIEQALFGAQPVIRVIIAECDTAPAGFALFFYNFSTFLGQRGIYLEDLFVKPDYRGRGVGRALLAYLAHLAQSEGCGRLEWSVLDWNMPAIGFYRSLGALAVDGWTVNRVTDGALAELAESIAFRAE